MLVESIFRVGYAANPILLSSDWPLFCTTKLELINYSVNDAATLVEVTTTKN
jgi:hypothetical protein